MADHLDALETRDAGTRAQALAAVLPQVVAAAMRAPAQAARLAGIDPAAVTGPRGAGADPGAAQGRPACRAEGGAALRRLRRRSAGVLRAAVHLARADLRGRARRRRPVAHGARLLRRGLPGGRRGAEHVLLSPDARRLDHGWRAAGAGLRGDPVRAGEYRGAARPDRGLPTRRLRRHAGFPEDPARCRGGARRVLRSGARWCPGAAFPPSLQAEIAARGIDAFQMYGTADLGCVAYETPAREGLVVAEEVLVEIVRPGTGDPVPDGEVGEVVVTRARPRASGAAAGVGRSVGGAARRVALRAHQHAHRRLARARRPDGEGEGHVRAAGAGGRDRRAASRGGPPAPGGDARGGAGCDDVARRGAGRRWPRRWPRR